MDGFTPCLLGLALHSPFPTAPTFLWGDELLVKTTMGPKKIRYL